ncbi:MAG: hypothetical protein IPK60_19355 [Sandaracinaceae bacterium]|jgi:hypothetical protein|nr:hypothetical protein [Sandaracinaceae bacterium]
MNRPIYVVTLSIGILAAGCSTHLYSPPARLAPLESAATVGADRTALQLEGGAGDAAWANIYFGTLRARHGFTDNLDGVMEANFLAFEDGHVAPSLRIGGKINIAKYLAFTGGVGAGTSSAGGFFSPDIGFIAAYENPYLVPFFSVRAWTSSPLGPRTLTLPNNDGDMPMLQTYRPHFTFGDTWTLGMRLPIREEDGSSSVSLYGGFSFIHMVDAEKHDYGRSLNFGAEATF